MTLSMTEMGPGKGVRKSVNVSTRVNAMLGSGANMTTDVWSVGNLVTGLISVVTKKTGGNGIPSQSHRAKPNS